MPLPNQELFGSDLHYVESTSFQYRIWCVKRLEDNGYSIDAKHCST